MLFNKINAQLQFYKQSTVNIKCYIFETVFQNGAMSFIFVSYALRW